MVVNILVGDCLTRLRELPSNSVHTCVTSPPYFGLRSYMPDGVRLRGDLSADERARVLAELTARGILPITEML